MSILERINKSIGVLLIAAITITLSIFLYDFYSIVTNSTQRETENHIVQSTMTSANMIHEKLKSDLNTVYTLSSELSGYENIDSPKAKAFLKKVGNELPFSIIIVSNIDGTYYTNTGSDINLKEPKYLIGAAGTKKTISLIYQNALFGRDMIALESSIYQNNKVVGKVSGLYYTNYINNILDYTANGNEHQYQIIERSGTFVLPSGISIFRNYQDIYSFFNDVKFSRNYETNDFINDFVRGKAGVVTFQYGGGVLNNLCYVPIGINDWYLVTIAPANAINLQAFTMQNPTVLLSIRIIILFIVLILYIIWRQMRYRVAMEKSRDELEVLNEKLQIRNETLKLKAENDLLTGLYNKITSERMINDFLENEGRSGRHALFIIDIDDFKGINDELGHFIGDKALTEVANGIDHHLRTTDLKGRIGGDEFIVLLKDFPSNDTVIQKANEICSLFKEIKIEKIPMLKISGSIGISIYPDHAANYADLFIKADRAMYYSKELGKDRYSIYSSDLEN